MVTNIFTNGTVADATKVNQNFTDIESAASAGIAQNAYQTIQANNIFQNKDYLAVDEYTIAGGTNTTVNTGSSTASFNGNQYDLSVTGTSENAPNEVQTGNAYGGFTISLNAINSGYITSISMQSNSGSTLPVTINIKNSSNVTIATKTVNLTTIYALTVTTFTSADYSEPISAGPFSIVFVTTTVIQIAATRTYSGTNFSYTSQTVTASPAGTGSILTFTTAAPNISGKTVVCDTGTLTLDGTEKSIQIYADNTLPTGNGPDGTDDTTATSLTLSTSGAVTDKRGLKINPNEDLYVQSVTKNSTSTATTAYIYDTVPTLITSATFSGNTATFGTQTKLTSGTNYYLLTDGVGNSYTSVTDSTVTFPLTSAILDITAGVNSTSTEITSEYYNLTSIVTQTNSATSPNATSVSVDISDGIIVGISTDSIPDLPFGSNVTDKRGWKITTKGNLKVSSITKKSSSGATTVYITDTLGTVVANGQATFSANVATFSTQPILSPFTDYYVVADAAGATYLQMNDSGVNSHPISGVNLDFIDGINNGTTIDTTKYYNLIDITTESVSVDNTVRNVKFTNNSTGVIDISSLSSGTLKLTYNLITLDTAVTPSTKGWGVFIFK